VIVILAAGRATRLGGTNKLLVEAAGLPVHEWHRRAAGKQPTYAVVRPDDEKAVLSAAPWLAGVIPHAEADGPSGALLSASTALPEGALTVLFADTLLPQVPTQEGDWVGVATAPWRIWDYYDASTEGGWTRGVPEVLVCCGIYRFTNRELLNDICYDLKLGSTNEVHMADVLRSYAPHQPLTELIVTGWQDAGAPDALKRVQPIKET
jgi:hypothetical protein